MKGGQSITADAPLDRMPIYAKAGSIVAFRSARGIGFSQSRPHRTAGLSRSRCETSLSMKTKAIITTMSTERYSVIPMHWDDKAQRSQSEIVAAVSRECWSTGPFELCASQRQHGIGISTPEKFDATIDFTGKSVSVDVPIQ